MKARMNGSRWVLATVVVALALVSWGAALSDKPGGNTFSLTVVADLSTFDIVPSANGGPFYVGGVLEDPDTGEEVGLFHCWASSLMEELSPS